MPSVLPNVRVQVLFFGRLREMTSLSEEFVKVAQGATIEDLFQNYADRFPGIAAIRPSLVASRNQEFAAWDSPLGENDTIAFLPPVSGG